jgi:hypothetical protein
MDFPAPFSAKKPIFAGKTGDFWREIPVSGPFFRRKTALSALFSRHFLAKIEFSRAFSAKIREKWREKGEKRAILDEIRREFRENDRFCGCFFEVFEPFLRYFHCNFPTFFIIISLNFN